MMEVQSIETTMDKRQITLPDGRYLIFYSFDAPLQPPPEETGISAFDEPYEMLDV